ncbi:MAG: (2Fe-2S)-binding protein [Chloroflexota bacterium]|nr:(2Fe-2S)-binding protein [Chloroflexota bacterium]
MKVPVNVTVNGTPRAAEVEPRTLLVYFLRDTLGMTGTHIGCQTGQCGACTVLLDGEAVKSCMVLAVQAEGREVTSIEGLAPAGTLHPVQQAFWEEHGLQCGYCTPGMVLAAHALLQENPDPDEAAVRHALEGNLCRCTGYQNVVASVRAAAAKLASGAQPEPVIPR